MIVLENILGVPTEAEQLSVCNRLDALFAETSVIRNEISDQRDVVLIHVEEFAAALDAQGSAARKTQSQLETEIALLKRAMRGLPREGEMATKVKVLEPKPFNATRSAKNLENFLWDMEQYFKATRVPDQEMVTITSMYLSRDAKLWRRTHVEDDENAGKGKIESWEALKKELKD